MLTDFAEKAVQFALENGAQYCDARAESITTRGFLLENGQVEHYLDRSETGLGIRILSGGAWGFYSVSEPQTMGDLRDGIVDAIRSALHYSKTKKQKVRLAEAKAYVDSVAQKPIKKPTLEDMFDLALECDKIIRTRKKIHRSSISVHHDYFDKYFVNSEGSKISQTYHDTIANLSATASESGISETVGSTEGGRGGMEVFSGKNNIMTRAESISEHAEKLVSAKPAKEGKTTVIMNPDFVALLTHEILGHPSEADRVLGKEMAWAGGAWWAGKLGERVGSEELDVIDDPTMPSSLGCYKYDDEGIRASRKSLIEKGILVGHMQSRETASIFGSEPNSAMRSAGYSFMPLIRMACTCIGPGKWDQEEMIKGVKSGYLICDMKVPSIDMMRYNWSISCQYARKIENGECKELVRDVIVMGNSPEFFDSIDAKGRDFTVRPITNCGKGDPMQIMRMGNGGPHIRATAVVKSVENQNA
ncbi:MAG TPA: TldD/PmbA family protein [Candidatus Nitrosotalea sp.]|nr:TldD/PmbA family protein [Candidatus Nitrosotalea sp.]